MKTFTKHILLLALMLFGVAGAAWADRAPQKFTGPVDIYDLMDGDTLASGFSLTYGHGQQEIIRFVAGRYSIDGTPQAYPGGADLTNDHELQSLIFTASNILMYFGEERTDTIAPMVDMSTPGNAWVVSDFNKGTEGVTMKISGIYIAPDPTVPALDETTGNWNFLMPGSNKVVKAVLYDSIVLGPHVSVEGLAIEGKYANGTDTVYYYDTNSHSSITLRAADNDGQGRNFGYWADLDPTDPEYSSWYRYLSSGSFTCGDTFRAVYPENHTLSLVTPQGGGTLEIAGVTYDTVYTITIGGEQHIVRAADMPYDTTFDYLNGYEGYDQSVNGGNGNVTLVDFGTTWTNISISGAFDGQAEYHCTVKYAGLEYGEDNKIITCTAGTQPKMPHGISDNGDGTYRVMEGLTVSVTATPDSAHYLSAIDGHDTVSNYACGYTFVMPGSSKDLLAIFNDKPTLTLAQTDGGTLEAIVPGPEPILTTINASDNSSFTGGSQTFDGVATVTLEGEYLTNGGSYMGWYCQGSHIPATVTVNPVDGYTIDSVKFYCQNGNDDAMDTEAPFMATVVTGQGSSDIQSYLNGIAIGYNGITKIEVYTTGVSKSNVIASSTPNTYYIDYGTPVTVKATPDAQHYLVRFSDDDNDTNSNLAVEKTYDGVVADIPDLTANFQAKPTLTLTANDGGTLTLDGMTNDTVYNINFYHIGSLEGTRSFTIPASRLPYDTTFSYGSANVMYAEVNETSGKLSKIEGDHTVSIRISGAFGYGSYRCRFEGMDDSDEWVITCTASTVPVPPAGVVSANATLDTFVVDYGTEVTVVAKPDSVHYLATLGGVTMGSNTAVTTPVAMTAPVELEATFTLKPTLTLAHNQGGEMEVIVPQGGVTAIVPPTDQMDGWESNYGGILTEDDLPAELGFVAVDQAAAAAWTGVPATGDAMLIYGIDGETFYYVSFHDGSLTGNDESTSSPGGFYDGASAGILYITTGVTPSNVTASAEPNTYYIDYNTSVTVKATPEVHYHLEGWSSNVTDNGDSTATLTLTQDETVSATFAQNAPELAWEYDDVILANGDTLSAYHGFEMDTIAKLIFSSNDEFFDAYMNALQYTGTSLLRFGSSNTNVVSFANPFDPQSLSVNAPGTATVYMVHDGSVMAYDSAYFTAVILAPDTLTLVHNDGGEMTVETLTDSVRAIVADTTYAVVPGANVTVKATPDSAHYLVNFDNDAAIYSNTDTTKHYVVNGNVTSTATFNDKPVLTLAASDTTWGKVTLEGAASGITQLTDSTYRVDYGTEVTVQAEATTLHHIAGWISEDSVAYPADSITYGNYFITEPDSLFPALSMLTFKVTADTTAEALFGLNSYDVFATAQRDDRDEIGSGLAMGRIAVIYTNVEGSVQGAGPADTLTYTAQGGSTSMLVVNSNYGYDFSGWYDVAADTLLSDAAMLSLTAAATVEARFVPDTFEVSAVVAVPGDTLAAAGTVTGAARYAYREMVTLEETPATGYHFVNWTAADSSVVGTDDSLTLQLVKDTVLTANFDTNVYNVVADVNIEGLGTVTGAGEVKHFLSTTLVATANLKYHFVMWVNAAGDSVSAADTLEVFPVGDTALTAVFDTNIYATVWSGETDTTYTSLPYEGLTATYTDFWGNEHTPVLTFVCGDQTVVTPNYPVTAGTWTVTATGAEGDSLTAPETTLTIKRAIVNVTGAVVETAKFADGTTTAVVTNAGTLNNVQGSDRVQHTTTAAYNTATVGDNKTITVTYALNGAAALLANYTLTPTTEVYTTEGYIIEPMVPNTDRPEDDTTVVEQGFDVYAYGYCTGSGYSIRYHLNTGAPDQYKLDFADSRFTDVDWTNLATPGADGTIDIMVPVDMPMGDYSVTVTFRDSRFTWLESAPMTMNFHINLPETFTMPLFNNVIALVDTCQCFSDIQWYHRANSSEEWKAIPGANGYYYHATDAELEGEFFVKAKYNGVETFTCPQTDMETLYTDDEQTVSVTAYPNPTTDGVTITVDGGTEWVHTLRVLSTVGVEKESRTFEGFTTTVDMRGYAKGAYMVIVDGVVVRVVRN